jgi:hypothetical protein
MNIEDYLDDLAATKTWGELNGFEKLLALKFLGSEGVFNALRTVNCHCLSVHHIVIKPDPQILISLLSLLNNKNQL